MNKPKRPRIKVLMGSSYLPVKNTIITNTVIGYVSNNTTNGTISDRDNNIPEQVQTR